VSSPLLRVVQPQDITPRHAVGGGAIDPETLATAASMLRDITLGGDAAALAHARRLGDLREGDPHLYAPAALRSARDRLPVCERQVLERAAERIRTFALAQRGCLTDLTFSIPGGEAGHVCVPVRSAGCYAPGGRFPLPSSVLMTAVTARAAGVESVWIASPRPTDATLAAAAIAGADGLLAIGGVQGIAALARGLLGVPTGGCDMIVGPGNRWVTAAKLLISGEVGIDMLAGPSELVVLADETADARMVAADLLAQAEHDDDAVPILISTSSALVLAVEEELARQLASLPTHTTARAALRNGYATVVSSIEQAVALSDTISPEHLEVHARNVQRIASTIRNAGAVFVGEGSAEVFGDYGAGPNHVLPTGGTSRFRAGLSVFTFLRARTWLRIDGATRAAPLLDDAAALARMERLEGHARSAEYRRALSPGTNPMEIPVKA
jgi:phosphoribosyl-ATP pyrophosphohydrolase/phosphoribosyl-AMP cyclohydrolase/histidinol dehydrogenase